MLGLKEIVCSQHYTKSWPSGKSFVFTFEDAIVVFSIPVNYMLPRWLECARIWELSRLYAPDDHRENLLTEAISFAVREFHKLKLADALISYADPNAGHSGGVYKAASWTFLGQSEESRAYRNAAGDIISRRKFHSGRSFMKKNEVLALGYSEVKVPGKLRFARGLTRQGKRAIGLKAKSRLVGVTNRA